MRMDYREIMVVLFKGHTYTVIADQLRASPRLVRCFLRSSQWALTDVQGLSVEQIAVVFPNKGYDRDTSYADVDFADLVDRLRSFARDVTVKRLFRFESALIGREP